MPGLRGKPSWEMEFALLGLGCWAVAAVILWLLLSMQFRRMTGRQSRLPPEGERQLIKATAPQQGTARE